MTLNELVETLDPERNGQYRVYVGWYEVVGARVNENTTYPYIELILEKQE